MDSQRKEGGGCAQRRELVRPPPEGAGLTPGNLGSNSRLAHFTIQGWGVFRY